MNESYIPLFELKEQIFKRLVELSKLDPPMYVSYQTADGTWVDREPVPEYWEQEELIRRYYELQAYENSFSLCHNSLLIGIRLMGLISESSDEPTDTYLQWRIAMSVYQNLAID